MSVLLPNIGNTSYDRAEALLTKHASNIVGTFWVMNGGGTDEAPIPDWWVDIILERNQAQAILDAYEEDPFDEHDGPLSLGFCIIVTASQSNPADMSYVIQHLSMWEGVELLEILAKHNIPAHTEVLYPMDFLKMRFGGEEGAIPNTLKSLYKWNVQIWEDYCSLLMAIHGTYMAYKYWS